MDNSSTSSHWNLLEPLKANQYITAYMSLFSGTGKQQKDDGNFILKSDYGGGYALYMYVLTSDTGFSLV